MNDGSLGRFQKVYYTVANNENEFDNTFFAGFKAGHIFTIKSHNAGYPTIMETLIFHTAKSMGLADDIYIPEVCTSSIILTSCNLLF